MKQTVRKMAGGAKSHGIPREGRKFYFGRTRIIKVIWSQVIGSVSLRKRFYLIGKAGPLSTFSRKIKLRDAF